ncbi:MAG: SDR family oxidoreductase [Deltaproteobacteria bacterium]|nr:SDR family oxidoreductase [Deltaproteobacteria bacterium]
MTVKKTILITGATAGIGRHAALELARRGHHVIATGRRQDALDSLSRESAGTKLDVMRLDVTDAQSIAKALVEVEELTCGRGIDVLINNAGYGQMGPIELVSDAEVRRQYDTNVFGLLAVTRAFLPMLRAKGAARIVNVSSIGGRVTFPLMGVYNSTKYAVESLSDALRNELAPWGIQVSLLEPGPIKTEFGDRAMDGISHLRDTTSPYAPVVARADEMAKQFESSSYGPGTTTRALVHAVESRRARIRYVAPFTAGILLWLTAIVPTRWMDAVMRRLTGLTPRAIAAAAPNAPRLASSSAA